jgi:mannose-6-phosphate isomerase-like protein (cupin superfamily)
LNLSAYIESGILELYVLDLLDDTERAGVERMLATHQKIRDELTLIQQHFEDYANVNRIEPPLPLRDTIVDSILNLQKEKEMKLDDLPIINQHSDYKNWLRLASGLNLAPLVNGKFEQVLRNDEHILQVFVIAETDIEEETHENEEESFLILAGQCRCTIGNKVKLMGPGDFMKIPLYEPHDVSLVTTQVTAILQRIKI